MAVRIAMLGWGSLLWEGGTEFDRQHDHWRMDGPSLPVEFSRISGSRQGALTLVIDSDHGSPARVAWCLSKRERVSEASSRHARSPRRLLQRATQGRVYELWSAPDVLRRLHLRLVIQSLDVSDGGWYGELVLCSFVKITRQRGPDNEFDALPPTPKRNIVHRRRVRPQRREVKTGDMPGLVPNRRADVYSRTSIFRSKTSTPRRSRYVIRSSSINCQTSVKSAARSSRQRYPSGSLDRPLRADGAARGSRPVSTVSTIRARILSP